MTDTPSKRQESIDRFLLGQMSRDEETEFRMRLQTDPTLADEVGLMRRIIKAISVRASRRNRMNQWDGAHDKTASKNTSFPIRRHIATWISVAASLAAIILIASVFMFRSADSVSDAITPKATEKSAPMGKYRGTSSDIFKIEHQLEQLTTNADATLLEINSTISSSVVEPGLREEEAEYTAILINHDIYELNWLRIKALIASGKIAEAKAELTKYANEEGYNQEEARTLLNQFE